MRVLWNPSTFCSNNLISKNPNPDLHKNKSKIKTMNMSHVFRSVSQAQRHKVRRKATDASEGHIEPSVLYIKFRTHPFL